MNKNELCNDAYTFETFVLDLRKNFLDPQWINHILRNIIYARMTESESFETYANRVLSGNNLLAGTDNHLPKAILRDTIENHLADYLCLKIDSLPSSEREHMIDLATFDEWLIFMRRLDDAARAELQRYKNFSSRRRTEVVEQQENSNRDSQSFPSSSSRTTNENRPVFKPIQKTNHPYKPNKTPYATGSNALPNSRMRVYLPRLTDDEREVLDIHHGCKKCRRFYVQHDGSNCPNDFPDGTNYKPLSFEVAADVYKASQRPGYDAFHGIDIVSSTPATLAPIFAWGGPPSTNPLARCTTRITHRPTIPRETRPERRPINHEHQNNRAWSPPPRHPQP
jgi:hypothetical protein